MSLNSKIEEDLEALFDEQDKRMNMPDEDLSEYMARTAVRSQETVVWNIGNIEMPRTRASFEGQTEPNCRNSRNDDSDCRSSSTSGQQSGVSELGSSEQIRNSLKRKATEANVDAIKKRSKHSLDSQRVPDLDQDPPAPAPDSIPEIGDPQPTERVEAPLVSDNPKEASLPVPNDLNNCNDDDVLEKILHSMPPKRSGNQIGLQSGHTPNVPKEHVPSPDLAIKEYSDTARLELDSPHPLNISPIAPFRAPLGRPASPQGLLKRDNPATLDNKDVDVEHPTSPIEEFSEDLITPARSEKTSARTPLEPTRSDMQLFVRRKVIELKKGVPKQEVTKLNRARSALDQEPIVISDDEPSVVETVSSSTRALVSPLVPPQPVANKIKPKTLQTVKSEAIKTTTSKSKGKGKAKPQLLTPVQYVERLHERLARAALKPSASTTGSAKPLEGLTIFYTGGDMTYASERTRTRMEMIVKKGGNLVSHYDPATVTHIVTDAQLVPTLRALGLKKVSQIPEDTPTVKWSWVVDVLDVLDKEDRRRHMVEAAFSCAAFASRLKIIDRQSMPSRSFRFQGKGKAKATEIDQDPDIEVIEASHISESAPKRWTTQQTNDSRHSEDSGPMTIPTGGPLSPPASPRQHSHHRQRACPIVHPAAPITSKKAEEITDTNDPLAEFYAQAQAEIDEEKLSRSDEVEESDLSNDEEEEANRRPPRIKRGFTCDNKDARLQTPTNQDIIEKLQELMELHKAKPGSEDQWRAFSYSKCIRALRTYPKRIKSLKEARQIPGVGEKTALKIVEIIETGQLRRIQYERTEDVEVTKLFQGIYGVGQSTALMWYTNGCRSLMDLKSGKFGIKLSPAQEIGLIYYDDINSRMPRNEAKALFDLIKPIAHSFDPELFVEIMGSYRRGKADCGDIDILITRNPVDGKSHAGILRHLIPALYKARILTDDLALPEHPNGEEAIYRGLCHLPQEGTRRRRIDILTVPWKSRGAAMLYYTGDDIFNRAMRLKANVLGYSLNQRGLFSGVIRDPRDRRTKLNDGSILASETEEEIFNILGVPWQEPHERVRAVA